MKCGDNGGLNSLGDPCRRDVKPGFTRCSKHGAQFPESKIKAEHALALARMPAIEALQHVLDQFLSATCATCGFPSGDSDRQRVAIRAAEAVLNRTGFGSAQTITVTPQNDGAIALSLLTPEERAELTGLLAQIKCIKDAVRARQVGAPPPMDQSIQGVTH